MHADPRLDHKPARYGCFPAAPPSPRVITLPHHSRRSLPCSVYRPNDSSDWLSKRHTQVRVPTRRFLMNQRRDEVCFFRLATGNEKISSPPPLLETALFPCTFVEHTVRVRSCNCQRKAGRNRLSCCLCFKLLLYCWMRLFLRSVLKKLNVIDPRGTRNYFVPNSRR